MWPAHGTASGLMHGLMQRRYLSLASTLKTVAYRRSSVMWSAYDDILPFPLSSPDVNI